MSSKSYLGRSGLLFVATLLLAACVALPRADLATDLDSLLADPTLSGAITSLTVRDAGSGAMLYQHNADTRLIPASSLKLLTSAAALDVLGADYRFSTQLLSNGRQQGNALMGNLYLQGTGDPSIQREDYRALAAQLAQQGIRRISGDLVFDDSWFDAVRLGTEWANDDEDSYYAAQISALSVAPDSDFNAGSVIVTLQGASSLDAPVGVSIRPVNTYMTVLNRGTTGQADTLSVNRAHGSNVVTIDGSLRPGQFRNSRLSVWEPTALVADLFRQALAEQGIHVQGRVITGGVTPSAAQVLLQHESIPLAELINPLLKLSNNNMSEVLLKAMGRKTANAGTARAGLQAIDDFLKRQGIETDGLKQFDGSGLSRRNLISSRALSDLLIVARHQSWFDAWYNALPIAGNPERMIGGGLRNRMRGTVAQNNLHAKTGSLTSISSLSGYITSTRGRPLAFVMLTNNYLVPGSRVKSLEDKVAVAVAQAVD